MNTNSATITALTPVGFMIIYLILVGLLLPKGYMATGYIWIPIILINYIIVFKVGDKGYMLKREEEEKRYEMERLLREQRYREEERKRQEEYRRERLKAQMAWEEFVRQYHEQQVDRNMINAMKLLELEEGFTKQDVKAAYRKMSKIHHPDVGGLEVNFKRLNKAYKYIMDRI